MNHSGDLPVSDIVWTPELVDRFWNYEITQTHNSFSFKHGKAIAKFIRLMVPPPGRIVDVGAGPGFLTEALLNAGFEVASVEDSQRGQEMCTLRNFESPGFLGTVALANARRLGKFDAAIAVEVIEHLNNLELSNLLKLIVGLLNPDASCILTAPNEEELSKNLVVCPQCSTCFHRWQHVRSVDAGQMMQYTSHPGLRPVLTFATDWSSHVPAYFRGRALSRRRRMSGPHLVGVARRANK
jgi:SAM-dependent methyltransferase